MPFWEAIVMGLVAGAAAFFPISAPAHLLLIPFILGWREPSAPFQIAVYAGALAGLVVVFKQRWSALLSSRRAPGGNRTLLAAIVVASVPAAVIGLAFGTLADSTLTRPVLAAILVGFTGWLLMNGERFMAEHEERLREEALVARRAKARGEAVPPVHRLKNEGDIDLPEAIVIGAAEGVAVVPGISRTGATLVAAMHAGLTREAAVAYSFLLAAPAIAGAIVVKLPAAVKDGLHGQPAGMVLGAIGAGVAAVFAIRAFTRSYVRTGLRPWGLYCFALAIAGILSALARG